MHVIGWLALGIFYVLFPLTLLVYLARHGLRRRYVQGEVRRQMLEALQPLPPQSDPARVRRLQQELVDLGQPADQAREPVRSWGRMLQTTGQALDDLLLVGAYHELLDNPSLQVGSYFNGRLNRHIREVRAALLMHDGQAVTSSIQHLNDQIQAWRDLTGNWSALRDIARASISTAVDEADYVELRHASQVRLYAPDAPPDLTWNAWAAVYADPAILEPLADWLVNALPARGWEFDVICTLSTTGIPLATLLSVGLKRALLARDSETGHFMPRRPQPDERLLLVDATVQTGSHIQAAEAEAEDAGATVVGAVTIAVNDMLPPEVSAVTTARWLADGRLIYFYRLSDLYRHWQAAQRNRNEATP